MERITILFLSFLPISEIRGSILYGILKTELPVWEIYFLSILGNSLVIFSYFFFEFLLRNLEKIAFKNILKKYFQYQYLKNKKLIERLALFGLFLLVAIPLPFSGAWTGTLISVLFKIEFKKAFFPIFGGILIAGMIVLITVSSI